jgi:NADPH2:quinone reductase
VFAHKIVGFTGPDDVQWVEAEEPTAGAAAGAAAEVTAGAAAEVAAGAAAEVTAGAAAGAAAGGGVVIEVAAAGVSFADLLQTRGAYQMRVALPYTPGMDAAGVIRSAPSGLGLRAGQRVAVLLSHGCWQEVISAPAERVLPLPDDLGLEAGAAVPLNYLTGMFALVRRARARAGETLLVHGAAGGVGTAAVQLGRALGLRTIAVTSDEAKQEFALRCGADHAVLSDGWLAAVRDLAGERAVDIVLDPVGSERPGGVRSGGGQPGSDRMTDSLRSLAPEGRLLVLGFAGGDIPVVKVNRLLLGNTGVLGVASREFFEQRPETVSALWGQLMELWRTGALADPPVEAYPFDDARGALRAIADRRALGKVVLSRGSAWADRAGQRIARVS